MNTTEKIQILDPQSLLDGSPATGLSPAATAVDVDAISTGLAHWAGQVKLYSRAGIAAMAMAGLHLRALRVSYFGPRNSKGGRPRKPDTMSGFQDWNSMLADVGGITERTAERWMKIADAVEAMAADQGGDIITICQKLPWEWTPEESERLGATVRKLTEDKTQRELLQADFLPSLGFNPPERINTSNNPLGKNGSDKPKPVLSQAELRDELQKAARMAFFGTEVPGKKAFGSVAFFLEQCVENHLRDIEALPAYELDDVLEIASRFVAALRDLIARLRR